MKKYHKTCLLYVYPLLLMLFAFDMPSAVAEAMSMSSNVKAPVSMGAMNQGSMSGGDAPSDARDPNAYADGYNYRGMAGWEQTDEIVFGKVLAEQLEFRNNNHGNNTLRWDIQGWRGTDYHKLWIKTEGENEISRNVGELEVQTLYSQAVAPFWDFQVGARYDRVYDIGQSKDRFFGVVGFQGLAPYWFDMESALFISDKGDVSARISSTYDLLLTQRLILQPRFEINVAASEVRRFGVGKGVNDIQLGLRLRYEMRREIAPYLGISWLKRFGDTAKLARTGGEAVDNLALIAGIRLWF